MQQPSLPIIFMQLPACCGVKSCQVACLARCTRVNLVIESGVPLLHQSCYQGHHIRLKIISNYLASFSQVHQNLATLPLLECSCGVQESHPQ